MLLGLSPAIWAISVPPVWAQLGSGSARTTDRLSLAQVSSARSGLGLSSFNFARLGSAQVGATRSGWAVSLDFD